MAEMPTFNVLLVGPIGSGKTHSSKTLTTHVGLETGFLALEPGVDNVAADVSCEQGLHIRYIPPANVDWDKLKDIATKLGTLGPEQLQRNNMRAKEYQQLMDVIEALADYTCDRCGKNLGPVDSWGPDRAIVVDGLTGLSKMAMHLVAGPKPNPTQPEWGSAQNAIRMVLDKLIYNSSCTFVLCAHADRKQDEVNGGMYTTVSTLGQKLAPDIPKPFDEVIYCRRESKNKFFWSTERQSTDLKARVLPFGNEIEPNFKQLFDAYWQMKGEG